MGVDAYSFAAALNGIVAQRLVRVNCAYCARPVDADSVLLDELALTKEMVHGWKLMQGEGCGQCRGTGFKGRRAVAEVLVLNDALRELIARKAPISEFKAQAQLLGWMALGEAALELVQLGETTLGEVARVAG